MVRFFSVAHPLPGGPLLTYYSQFLVSSPDEKMNSGNKEKTLGMSWAVVVYGTEDIDPCCRYSASSLDSRQRSLRWWHVFVAGSWYVFTCIFTIVVARYN